MPLTTQLVDVPFVGGVDTKTEPKALPPARLQALVNGVFTAPGEIGKRFGYENLLAYGSSDSCFGVAAFRDELLAFGDSTLTSYNETTGVGLDRGEFVPLSVRYQHPAASLDYIKSVDMAALSNGMRCFVWQSNLDEKAYYSILNEDGVALVSNRALTTGRGDVPRVVTQNDAFAIFYVNTSEDLVRRMIYTDDPDAPSAEVVVIEDIKDEADSSVDGPKFAFDVCTVEVTADEVASDVAFAFAHVDAATDKMVMASITEDETVDDVDVTNETAGVYSVTVFPASTGGVVFAWAAGTLGKSIYAGTLTSDLSTNLWAAASVELSETIHNISGCATGAGTAKLFFELSNRSVIYSYSSSGLVASDVFRDVYPVAKIGIWDGRLLLFVATDLTDAQVFCLDATTVGQPAVIAKACPYGVHPGTVLGQALMDEDGFEFAVLATTNPGGSVVTAPRHVRVDKASQIHWAEFANGLHISAGGPLWLFDGATIAEHGFHHRPDAPSAAVAGGDAGTTYSYQYVITYEWLDARGQLHQSAESLPTTKTTGTVISSGHACTLAIKPLRFTAKSGVKIAVWRTVDKGEIFYRVNPSTISQIANDATAETSAYVDSTTDATLLGRATLYTTGGRLFNEPISAAGPLLVHQGRLFVLDAAEPNRALASHKAAIGYPAEFSSFVVAGSGDTGTRYTALGSLDEKLVLFGESKVSVVAGDGPDALGGNGYWTEPQQLPSDVGCAPGSSKSVITTPLGLFFKAAAGIHLLDRGLGISYIGAEVERWNVCNVLAAALVPGTTQVRFALEENVSLVSAVLVYDYLVRQWSVFQTIAAIDLAKVGGRLVLINAAGTVLRETPGVYSDDGNWIILYLKTAWIRVGGMQAFQRVRRLHILGEGESDHALTCRLVYDYRAEHEDSFAWDSQAAEHPYERRIHLPQQKCEAIQVEIFDSQAAAVAPTFEPEWDYGPEHEGTTVELSGTPADDYPVVSVTVITPGEPGDTLVVSVAGVRPLPIVSGDFVGGDLDLGSSGLTLTVDGPLGTEDSWLCAVTKGFAPTIGQGVSLSGLTFEVGLKKGGRKLPAAQSA